MVLRHLYLVVIWVWFICLRGNLKAETFFAQNPCLTITTCQKCIQTPFCAWCYKPISEFEYNPRCFHSSQQHKECPEDYIYFPYNHHIVTIENDFNEGQVPSGNSETTNESRSKIIQMTPQKLQMQLKVGVPHSIRVSYAPARDYPIDLYYLMDLSRSMEDDREELSVLSDLFIKTMNNITKDFQIGFGSFIDKVVMPFASVKPTHLVEPCRNCAAPYGYKNHLSLTTDTTKFSNVVNSTKVSGGLDAPEGGFDAIVQAVVCKEQIGWRDAARKLIVFATDDGFHYAGDGRLAGIITPNDGQCHLNDDGYYSYSSLQDFPSISQLNVIARENAVNVIFAVSEKHLDVYNRLLRHIEGSSSGILSGDSSNIVELVRRQYEEILSTVEMKDNATDAIEIKYYSNCLNSFGKEENNTNICNNLKNGQTVDFRLDILLKECPKDSSKWNQTIKVHPVGLSQSLLINLQLLCPCLCEDPSHEENAVWEYSLDDLQNQNTTIGCKSPNANETLVECSGRGNCFYDQCQCNIRDNPSELIYGTRCECDNYSCYYHGGQMCGGNGICNCGECNCNPPWSGEACDCFNSTSTCFSPFAENSKLCSGHGDCLCGACQCHKNCAGPYCEECLTYDDMCDELQPCVLCQLYLLDPYDDDACVKKCGNFTIVEVSTTKIDLQPDEKLCTAYDKHHCKYEYIYIKISETRLMVRTRKEDGCPPEISLLKTILKVIVSIILPGLIIALLFKFLVNIYDRKKLAESEEHYMRELDTIQDENSSRTSLTFNNPIYAAERAL